MATETEIRTLFPWGLTIAVSDNIFIHESSQGFVTKKVATQP
jgi:hypothetical protein